MNNFNALNQYVASMNQSMNALSKSIFDLNNRVRALENSTPTQSANLNVPVSTGPSLKDVESVVDKRLEKQDAIIEKKIEDVERKLEDLTKSTVAAIAELKITQTQAPAQEEIVIPDIVGMDQPLTDDDFLIGIKEEKKTTKRPPKKKN